MKLDNAIDALMVLALEMRIQELEHEVLEHTMTIACMVIQAGGEVAFTQAQLEEYMKKTENKALVRKRDAENQTMTLYLKDVKPLEDGTCRGCGKVHDKPVVH